MLQSSEGIVRLVILVLIEIGAVVGAAFVIQFCVGFVLNRIAGLSDNEMVQSRCQLLRRTSRVMLLVSALVLLLGALLFNAYLVWQDKDAVTVTLDLLRHVPPETWIALAFGVVKAGVAALLARFLKKLVSYMMTQLDARARAWEGLQANDSSISAFFNGMDRVIGNVLWMLVVIYAFRQLRMPEPVQALLLKAVTIYLIIAVGLIIVRMTAVIVDTLDALSQKFVDDHGWRDIYQTLRPLVPLLRRCLEYVLWIGVATMVTMQLEPIQGMADYGPGLIKAIGIFFVGRVAMEIGYLFIDRHTHGAEGVTDLERRRRETLQPLIKSIFKYGIYFGCFVLMLRSLGFDPMPFLAGAGIIGIVVGLGAQPLIHDIVSGFFIIFEHQYLVGDFIEIDGARGTVEAIDFRTTHLRDVEGRLHIIRNGEMRSVVNFSKDYTNAVVDVRVGYDADIDQVTELLHEVGQELADDESVLEQSEIRGIVSFNQSDLTMRTVTKVRPGCHAEIAARIRHRIKQVFDKHGVRIPVERREVLIAGDDGGAPPRFAF